MIEEWVTVLEVAKAVHVSPHTIRYWISQNWLPANRVGFKLYRIRRKDARALVIAIVGYRQKFSLHTYNELRVSKVIRQIKFPSSV